MATSTAKKKKVLWTPERRAQFSREQKARYLAKHQAEREALTTVLKAAEGQAAAIPKAGRPALKQVTVKLIALTPRATAAAITTFRDLVDLVDTLEPGEEILLTRRT